MLFNGFVYEKYLFPPYNLINLETFTSTSIILNYSRPCLLLWVIFYVVVKYRFSPIECFDISKDRNEFVS